MRELKNNIDKKLNINETNFIKTNKAFFLNSLDRIYKKLTNIEDSKWYNNIDKKDAITTYWNTRAVRNFNPWNIKDLKYGGKEGKWGFTVFESPRAWWNALIEKIKNIQLWNSLTYWPNPTIESYIKKYAPPSDKNDTEWYIKSICDESKVTRNTLLKKVNPITLGIIHSKKEDWKCYKMLKDLKIIW